MKSLVRSYVWWPSLNKDIENICKNCDFCQSMQPYQRKGMLQLWPIPKEIWERIHIDFLGPINGKYCFCYV